MFELELKAILRNKLSVIKILESRGCEWTPISQQTDIIYENRNMSQIIHTPVFRIRKCNMGKILTLKVIEEDLDTAKELELLISDDIIMNEMLNIIGFVPKIKIVKKRQNTEYKGFKIFIDDVIGLGNFIEIEMLSESYVNKEDIYKEMKIILKELGINEKDLRKEKYYKMLLKKKTNTDNSKNFDFFPDMLQ